MNHVSLGSVSLGHGVGIVDVDLGFCLNLKDFLETGVGGIDATVLELLPPVLDFFLGLHPHLTNVMEWLHLCHLIKYCSVN